MSLYEWVGKIVLLWGCFVLVVAAIFSSIEFAGRAWRARYQWAYMRRAVREYGERHPEEKAKALGEKL